EAALGVLGPTVSFDVLDSLGGKSLLRQAHTAGGAGVETGEETRLVMLETIRELGREQLVQTAELDDARHAHAIYYLSLAEGAEQQLIGRDQQAWLQRLDREQDNFRAALRWACEQRAAGLAQRLAGALWRFWFARGYWSEGRRWLEE